MPETRVTAGEWRGRVIETPRGMSVRPTRGVVRQSLFNILGARVEGARVLDLFAGAGTLGFESLSRGARSATFVDMDREALRSVAATAERFGCSDRCRLVRSDVARWLRREPDETRAADICFVDAPYRDPDLDRVLTLLGASPPRLVVCEHHERRQLPETVGALTRIREVRHGLTTVSLLQSASEPTSQHT